MMDKLLNLSDLTQEESYELFSEFSQYSPEKQSAILALLRAKKESVEEILGAVQLFSQHSKRIHHDLDIIDIVGTGGDGINTFNISTAAGIVTASCGVITAKHGGKCVTSRTGSQNVISELGIKIPQNAEESLELLQSYHFAYLWAPLFNEELKKYGNLRAKLGFPTILHVLGPLLNPMHPKKRVIGVYRKDLLQKVAKVLEFQRVGHALVIHSEEGLDEMSISNITHVVEIKDSSIKEYTICPKDLGMQTAMLSDIIGNDDDHGNANIVMDVLSGKTGGPKLDVVLLNAAAGLYVAGKVDNITCGIDMAKKAVSSGDTFRLFDKLRGKT